jgi:hypothetical protein
MTETLADNNKMGAIFDADDRLKAAMERIKHLRHLSLRWKAAPPA